MNINTPVKGVYGELVDKYLDTWKKQAEVLQAKFGSAIEEIRWPRETFTDMPVVYVKKESVIAVLEFMKSSPELEYGFLSDITATDEETDPRFEIVYQLLSHKNMARIRVKVRVKDGEEVPTAVGLWEAANWAEREVWDMFGVKFTGHPDLRRILMDERWVGHPLRKDYPLRGYQLFPDAAPVNPKLLEN